jgi:hypothetical protein
MLFMTVTLLALFSSPSLADNEAAIRVSQSEICIPEGYFLLIRRAQSIGAIRLEHVKESKEAGTGAADYESYFVSDEGALSSKAAVRRHGVVRDGALVGIGRTSAKVGDTRLRLGPYSFDYGFPECVRMYQAGKPEEDEGFEFAPTDVTKIENVDARAAWRWFRVEKNRRLVLKLSELHDAEPGPTPP